MSVYQSQAHKILVRRSRLRGNDAKSEQWPCHSFTRFITRMMCLLRRHILIYQRGLWSCGTGLAGASLRPAARKLIGVDISPRMLEKARKKGLYDELVEMELGDYLQSHNATFDLIAASDVFNYFGKLSSIVGQAAHALRPKGKLAFSVECSDDETSNFKLGPHGRYSHNKTYLIEVIQQSGLQLNRIQHAVLRKEFDNEVTAFLVLASKR